jgi:hypothetical protein
MIRYPFLPQIVRFNSNKVTINRFKEEVTMHYKPNYQFDMEIANW